MAIATASLDRARRTAERCFALARSTTFAGERDAAVARGTAVATKAGLSLDEFDVPGRKRVRKNGPRRHAPRAKSAGEPMSASRFDDLWSGETKSPEFYTAADLAELMEDFRSASERAAAMSSDPEVVAWETRRRRADIINEFVARAANRGSGFAAAFEAGQLDRAMRRFATEGRDAQHARWPDLEGCVSFLMSRGTIVYDMGLFPEDDGPRWYAPGRAIDRLDDWQLRTLADEVAA